MIAAISRFQSTSASISTSSPRRRSSSRYSRRSPIRRGCIFPSSFYYLALTRIPYAPRSSAIPSAASSGGFRNQARDLVWLDLGRRMAGVDRQNPVDCGACDHHVLERGADGVIAQRLDIALGNFSEPFRAQADGLAQGRERLAQ